MKRFVLLVVLSFLCTQLMAQESMKLIIQEHLDSIPHPEPFHYNFNTFLEYIQWLEKMTFKPEFLEKRTAFLHLLDTQEVPKVSVIEQQERLDLHILKGPRKGDTFFGSCIDRTTTEIGKVSLYTSLALPISDPHILKQRQTAIRWLQQHPEIHAQCIELLQSCAAQENGFKSFFEEDHLRSYDEYNSWFPFFDKSRVGKEVNGIISKSSTAQSVMYNTLGLYYTSTYMLYLLQILSAKQSNITEAKGYQAQIDPYGWSYKKIMGYFGLGGDPFEEKGQLSRVHVLFGAAILYSLGKGLQQTYIQFTESYATTRFKQKKLVHFAGIFRNIKKLDALLEQYPELAVLIPHRERLAIAHQTQSKEASELFTYLSSNTFNRESKLILLDGKIHRALDLAFSHHSLLKESYAVVGYIDALCSCAQLLNEKSANHPYCLVDFIESPTPIIEIQDMWNPFVTQHTIPNSIMLGGNTRRNGILTGPNAGGKSTFIKALGLNLILAHTWGISASTSMRTTPFAKIMTSLNIVDDIVQGKSLFQAEVARMKHIVTTISQLEPDQFAFVLMDELFSGTAPEQGSEAAYQVTKQLGQKDTVMCFISTHFNQLTALEDVPGTYTNYKVCATVADDGTISYPFKIMPGISDQLIGLLLVQQEILAYE